MRKNKRYNSQTTGWQNKSDQRKQRINKIRENLSITNPAYKVKSHQTDNDDLQTRYDYAINNYNSIISQFESLVQQRKHLFNRYDEYVPIHVPFHSDVILQFQRMADELYESERQYKAWYTLTVKANKPRYAEIHAINELHKLQIYQSAEVLTKYMQIYIDNNFKEELDKYISDKVIQTLELDGEIYFVDDVLGG